MTLKVSTQ